MKDFRIRPMITFIGGEFNSYFVELSSIENGR
jgi:hypothetical protein